MRVAIDGMLLGRRASGVERSIANLIGTLAGRARHAYTVYTQVSLPGVAAVPTRWPVAARPGRIFWQQAVLPCAAARCRCDVLHAPGYVAPLAATVPVVLTVYDTLAFTHPELCTPANRWHYRLLLPAGLRKAARIVVPSETTRRDVLRLVPAAAGRVRVVPLGVEKAFSVVPGPDERDQVLRLAGGAAPYILFVGGLEPKKNVPRLVEAYGLLARHHGLRHRLVIAGSLSWDAARIRRTIRAQGLDTRITLAGDVPPGLLPALYRGADLFVFPSLYEGFGLPPLEAMACGVPAIVADCGALAEISGPASLVVDPASAGDMAEAMQAVLTRTDVRADLVARGLRHAAGFTWERTALAMEALYSEAGNGGRP